MKEYIFGVMSSKFKLKSESIRTAKLAMIMYLRTSAPIAIYEPKDEAEAFNPEDVIKEEMSKEPPDLKEVYQSIQRVEL